MKPKSIKVPVGLSVKQVQAIDGLIEAGIYSDRSEFLRTGARKLLEHHGVMVTA